MSSETKLGSCVVAVVGGSGRPEAVMCADRVEADDLAKDQAEQGRECAVYERVGTWKPKVMPVEFVAVESEQAEHELPRL